MVMTYDQLYAQMYGVVPIVRHFKTTCTVQAAKWRGGKEKEVKRFINATGLPDNAAEGSLNGRSGIMWKDEDGYHVIEKDSWLVLKTFEILTDGEFHAKYTEVPGA